MTGPLASLVLLLAGRTTTALPPLSGSGADRLREEAGAAGARARPAGGPTADPGATKERRS